MSLSTSTITAAAPATVTVTLLDASKKPLGGKVVEFKTTKSLGKFSADSALTRDDGTALVALYPASSGVTGADEVVASVSVNGAEIAGQVGFQLTATDVTIAAFTSDLGSSRLSAYGQTNLRLTLAGTVPGVPVSLTVSSVCAGKSKARITPETVSTTNGIASFTYIDQGCGATDAADSVQVGIVGTSSTQATAVALTSPAVSSIGFVGATPETIYLKGSGYAEASQVTFQVRDQAGNPLPNQSVTMDVTTLAGGLTLDGDSTPVTKLSDSSGQVTVRVNSGTVPTPVRIKATLDASLISTVSSSLSIAVGLPSQLNFSLSQQTHNIEGYNIDGTENKYNIIASDRLGNPVPDGTTINFIAEGSQIQASQQTALLNGLARASANFVSSEPRPLDGRITITAYALGEESFLDTNGDNVYTAGEAFQDLGNLFVSRKYSSDYDAINDQFVSLSISGTAACATVDGAKDPLRLLDINRTIPSVGGSTCDGKWGRAYVRRSIETVLSTSSARPLWLGRPAGLDAGCAKITLRLESGEADFLLFGAGGMYGVQTAGAFSVIAADANPVRLNPVAAGTEISAAATDGLNVNVIGGTPVANTTEATTATVSYKFTTASNGVISLNFKSPSGYVSSFALFLDTAAGTSTCSALE